MRKILKYAALGAVALIVIVVGISVAVGGGSSRQPASAASPATSSASPATPVTVPSSASAAPAMTGSQAQAVVSAQGYLSDGQGFSYRGLLRQLTSSAGEGFSQADAKFAIRHLHPDWNAQAVESARGYLNDGQGFSRSGLLQQLTSPYGEAFTQAQAQYAVNRTMG